MYVLRCVALPAAHGVEHLELDTLTREAIEAFRAGEMIEVKAPTPAPPSAPSSAQAAGSATEGASQSQIGAGQQPEGAVAAGDQSSATARSQLSQPPPLALAPGEGRGSALSPSPNRLGVDELAANTARAPSSLNESELRGGLTPTAPADALPAGPPHSSLFTRLSRMPDY